MWLNSFRRRREAERAIRQGVIVSGKGAASLKQIALELSPEHQVKLAERLREGGTVSAVSALVADRKGREYLEEWLDRS